ncbi:MAG: hypothetical protein ACR2I2_20055 [Bryobacteraceae bacterium]
MGKIATFALAAIWPLALIAAGTQTITLKNGSQFQGTMTNGSTNSITFQDNNGDNHRFDTSEVQSITFTNNGFNNSNNNGNNSGNNGNNNNSGYNGPRNASDRDRWLRQNSNGNNGNNGNPAGAGFGNVNPNPGANSTGNFGNAGNNNFGNNNTNYASTNNRSLPAGTQLSVRTNETIDSKTATDGRTYSAAIAQNVMDANGNAVIPQGSDANLVIKSLNGGSITSSSNLILDVQSVTVNGQRYTVSTQDVRQNSRQGVGANKRTAEIVGGGTALGTLLGAIGGGGTGALIGALAGAAAGAGVQVLTKGSEVRIPAETVLNFRLDQPMQLTPAY